MRQTAPERNETLQRQAGWLAAGRRKAVLFTAGTCVPALPRWARLTVTEAGVFAFRPDAITAEEIQQAVNEDRIGEVLGYGIARKPERGQEIGAVVLRSNEGIEKLAVVTDSKHLETVKAALMELQDDGDTVKLEECERVVRERTAGPLGNWPEVRPIRTQGELEALRLAAKADGYTPIMPTHLVLMDGEIVGCLSVDSLPLYRAWLHKSKVKARQSLAVMNVVENLYRTRDVPLVATMLQPDSPFVPQMTKLGYKTWGGALLFTKGL